MEKDTKKQPVTRAEAPERRSAGNDKKEEKIFSDALSEQWSTEKVREEESSLEKTRRFLGRHINPLFIAGNKLSSLIRRVLGNEKAAMIPDFADFGDVIFVERVGFSHYAVYVGNNQVIHYDMDPGDNYKICVHQASMQEFLNGSDVYTICEFPRIYGRPTEDVRFSDFSLLFKDREKARIMWDTLKGTNYRLYTPAETVLRARERIGETEYNLFTNNCEHFAIWCKTGLSESAQIEIVLTTLYETAHNIRESLREGFEAADDLAGNVAENLKRKMEERKRGKQ